MNDSKAPRTKSIASTILIAVLAIAYISLKPQLEEWIGTPLPPVAEVAQQSQPDKPQGPAAGTDPDTGSSESVTATDQNSNRSGEPQQQSNQSKPKKLGILTPEGRNFRSSAGLIYGPGSRDGHRRKHVLKHAEDDLSKPVHGVFDDKEAVFALVDEAYQKVKSRSDDVSTTSEGRRTSYVVKMRRRIGFKGGRNGKRDGKPPLNRLKLVLEGNEVVTAFPI